MVLLNNFDNFFTVFLPVHCSTEILSLPWPKISSMKISLKKWLTFTCLAPTYTVRISTLPNITLKVLMTGSTYLGWGEEVTYTDNCVPLSTSLKYWLLPSRKEGTAYDSKRIDCQTDQGTWTARILQSKSYILSVFQHLCTFWAAIVRSIVWLGPWCDQEK